MSALGISGCLPVLILVLLSADLLYSAPLGILKYDHFLLISSFHFSLSMTEFLHS